jgi:hypothetical protein
MYLRNCGSFKCAKNLGSANEKSTNYKKDWVRKSQNTKEAHLRKIRKYNKLLRSANLRICGPPTFFGITFRLSVS